MRATDKDMHIPWRKFYWEKLLFSYFNGNMTNVRALHENYGLNKQSRVVCNALQYSKSSQGWKKAQ